MRLLLRFKEWLLRADNFGVSGLIALIGHVAFIVTAAALGLDADWISAIATTAAVVIAGGAAFFALGQVRAARLQLTVWRDERIDEQDRNVARRVLEAAVAYRRGLEDVHSKLRLVPSSSDSGPVYEFSPGRTDRLLQRLREVEPRMNSLEDDLASALAEAAVVWDQPTDEYSARFFSAATAAQMELVQLGLLLHDVSSRRPDLETTIHIEQDEIEKALPWLTFHDNNHNPGAVTDAIVGAYEAIVGLVGPKLSLKRFNRERDSGSTTGHSDVPTSTP